MDNTNPLHQYRSYSYHHILCACKTTAAAESLAGTLTENLRDMPGAIQNPDDINVVNDFVVVINGFKDGDAFIKDLSWETVFAPSSNRNSRYKTTSMASEGEMTIVEPKGFRFFDIVNKVSKVLDVSNTNITWAIKTVFIGHKIDNTKHYIPDIKPLIFMMYDAQAKIDVTGSEYYLKFIGVSNGSAKLPCYNSVNPVSISVGKGANTLSDVMDEFVTVVNEKYNKDVDEMIARAKKSKGVDLKGRRIIYDVKLHDSYKELEVDNIILEQRGNVESAGTIMFPKNSNMEQMIFTIMRQSSKVNEAAAVADGIDNIFKIHTETSFTGNDTGILTITYYVAPYEVPKAVSDTDHNSSNTPFIEYDYMYSGKNVDILDFDIKMEFGLGFLQLLSVNNPLDSTSPISGEKTNTQDSMKPDIGGQLGSTGNADNTPKPKEINAGTLYPSKKYEETHSKGVVKNNDMAAFDVLLSKHSAIETLESKVKVLGNPYVMSDINTLPSEVTTDVVGETAFGSWKKGPPFIKINVFLPAKPNQLVVDDVFREQFWYRGMYRVISTINSFENGTFTQTHDILSMNLKDSVISSPATEKTQGKI